MDKIKMFIFFSLVFFKLTLTQTFAEEPILEVSILIDYNFYNILKVSDNPLFRQDGTVDQEVLGNLMDILQNPKLDPMLREQKTHWPTNAPYIYAPFTSITTEDFSDFVVPYPTDINESGAIVIKLFETIPNMYGLENGHLTEFTSQWWQLVYRATEEGNDVLSLWMMNPYRLTYFGGTRYEENHERSDERFYNRQPGLTDTSLGWNRIPAGVNVNRNDYEIVNDLPASQDYYFEGNYSVSIVRDNLMRDLEFLLNNFVIEEYLVPPANLPGNWQSSRFQTGVNANGVFFATGQFTPEYVDIDIGSLNASDGLGASGRWGGHRMFTLLNGMDGYSVGPVSGHFFNSDIQSANYDLLWLPSCFEIRSMGTEKDTVFLQTFIRYTGEPVSDMVFDIDEWRLPPESNIQGGRTGLWRVNGFDRGFNQQAVIAQVDPEAHNWQTYIAWLRSGITNSIGNVSTVSAAGNRYGCGVNQQAGLRPGIHLSLSRLYFNE